MFLSGTAAEVTPILDVDGRVIGGGEAGRITRRIQDAFFGAVRGKLPRYRKWLTLFPDRIEDMAKARKLRRHPPSKDFALNGAKRVKLDETDLSILSMLQNDARVSNAEIARRIGMVPSGILARLRTLNDNKVILSYETRLDARILGLGLTAFVFVRAKEVGKRQDTAKHLVSIPEVQEVHNITGEDCYLLKIRVRDPKQLGRVLRDEVGTIPSVVSTKTTIVLDTFKETTAIPIPEKQDS